MLSFYDFFLTLFISAVVYLAALKDISDFVIYCVLLT